MTGHNLRHKARIVALGALLVLLQACGGGGGGSPTMTAADCTDALPFFDSSDNTCKVAGGPDDCPDARPVFMTGGSCAIAQDATECPDARPVFMTGGSCVVAQSATDCPDARPVFMTGGSCAIAQDATECPDARPVFMTGGSCAIAQDATECPDARPVFMTGGSCAIAQDATECPDARPVFMTGGSCAIAQDATDCPDARPVFMTGGSCAIAQSATDCPDARPVFMTGGSCAIAQDATECPDARPVFMTGGSCAIAQDATECPDARPVFMTGGACRAEVANAKMIGTTIRTTSVMFREFIPDADTAAYDQIFAAAQNTLNTNVSTQSGNCGAPPCTQTMDDVPIFFGSGNGNPLGRAVINTGGVAGVEYTLDQVRLIPAPTGGTDRRENLGWNYARYELSDDEDPVTATADLIVWNNTTMYYLAGGVWAYDLNHAQNTPTRGASVGHATSVPVSVDPRDGFPTAGSTVDDATYTGHSFGHYVVLPAPHPAGKDAEPNRGYFAANASLNVSFEDGEVSGTISNFLFSTNKEFTVGGRSALEDALGGSLGLSVMLEPSEIGGGTLTTRIHFRDNTSASIMVDGAEIILEGKYGGLFFGRQGGQNNREAPLAVGGTWGAAGRTTDADENPIPFEDGGFGISFIGAFGAKVVPPPSSPP